MACQCFWGLSIVTESLTHLLVSWWVFNNYNHNYQRLSYHCLLSVIITVSVFYYTGLLRVIAKNWYFPLTHRIPLRPHIVSAQEPQFPQLPGHAPVPYIPRVIWTTLLLPVDRKTRHPRPHPWPNKVGSHYFSLLVLSSFLSLISPLMLDSPNTHRFAGGILITIFFQELKFDISALHFPGLLLLVLSLLQSFRCVCLWDSPNATLNHWI